MKFMNALQEILSLHPKFALVAGVSLIALLAIVSLAAIGIVHVIAVSDPEYVLERAAVESNERER